MPLFETLESRLVLTAPAVVSVDPPANIEVAPVGTDVAVRYDQDIDPTSVSAETVVVHGTESGTLLDPPNVLSVSGATVTLTPAAPFRPGELVQATATTGITNLGGEHAAAPYVWQFRTAVGVGNGMGSGYFIEAEVSLGDATGRDVALADMDGDGDLDAFIAADGPNEVWRNEGDGSWTDTRQRLGNSVARAVRLRDLDGDGDIDAVVANDGQINRVWLNDGSGTLVDAGQALGSREFGAGDVALGDVDGDGDVDAFVAIGERGRPNEVWLNDGRGTFFDSGERLGNSDSHAVDLGDLDGDGDLDAVVGNTDSRGEGNRVWYNDGSGRFFDSGQRLVSGQRFHRRVGNAVTLGDLDADGDLDIYIGVSGSNSVWLNDGEGRFLGNGQGFALSGGRDVALGDLDGDGDLDAFDQSTVLQNDGSGNFFRSAQELGAVGTHGVALGDVDADGDLDAFISSDAGNKIWLNGYRDGVADLAIAMTDGQEVAAPGEDLTYTVRVTNHGPADVTGASVTVAFPERLSDVGWTCRAVAGANCTANGTGDIEAQIDLPVGGVAVYSASGTIVPLTVGDVRGVATVEVPAGLLDFIPGNSSSTDRTNVPLDTSPRQNVHDALPTTDVSVRYDQDIDPSTVSSQSFIVHGMNTGQLTQPGNLIDVTGGDTVTLAPAGPFHPGELVSVTATMDIEALGGTPPSRPFVWQFQAGVGVGNGLGGGFLVAGEENPYGGSLLGDLDGDGDLDAIGNDKVLLNNGQGSFTDTGQDLVGVYGSPALGDLDGDGDLDLFTGYGTWLNDGTGSFTYEQQSLGNYGVSEVALGDFDGDGDLDAWVGNGTMRDYIDYSEERDQVLFNDGSGLFVASGQDFGELATTSVALGDLDGDGDLDAFVGNWRGPDQVWLNQGEAGFRLSSQELGNARTGDVELGDLDGDGDLDAFVANFGDMTGFEGVAIGDSVWINDGTGYFVDSGQSVGLSGSRSVALGDIDGDGDLDAFVGSTSQMGADAPVDKIWLNDGSGGFADSGQNLVGVYSATYRVALGDLDGDGDLDAIGEVRVVKVWFNEEFIPGDMNHDGVVNGLDVNGDGWEVTRFVDSVVGATFEVAGDINRDGMINGLDVQPFVDVLFEEIGME